MNVWLALHITAFHICESRNSTNQGSIWSWLIPQMEDRWIKRANCIHCTASFHIRDLSICGFWSLQGILDLKLLYGLIYFYFWLLSYQFSYLFYSFIWSCCIWGEVLFMYFIYLLFKFFVLVYSRLMNNVVIVSGDQWRHSFTYIHVSILPQTLGESVLTWSLNSFLHQLHLSYYSCTGVYLFPSCHISDHDLSPLIPIPLFPFALFICLAFNVTHSH